MVAYERYQWHAPAPCRHEQERPVVAGSPDEVTPNRSTKLDLVARSDLTNEVRRDLAIFETLDGENDPRIFGRRRDRIAPLRLIAVLCGQLHIDVLSGQVARPPGNL